MTTTYIVMIILMPAIGTLIGSASSLFLGKDLARRYQSTLLGFAAGVMVAAAVWSLLIPSIEAAADMENRAWIPALVGLWGGFAFMLLLDVITPHLHLGTDKPEGLDSSLGRRSMLMLAVVLHNIPEGMAIGVVVAGVLSGEELMSVAMAATLSLGIALQNAPEGAIISLPLRAAGCSRWRSFAYGTLSGIVEPIASVVTILLVEQVMGIFPYMLSAAAGAMLYVVVEELIPESQRGEHSNLSTIGFAAGFGLMMVLDVALG